MTVSTTRTFALGAAALWLTSGGAQAFVPQSSMTTTSSSSRSRSSSSHRSSALHSKNSDRARMERELEKAMGDDWRLFRAKLVAQEKAEEQKKKNSKQSSKESKSKAAAAANGNGNRKNAGESNTEQEDPMMDKQGQLGDLFGAAISSIFGGDHKNKQLSGGGGVGSLLRGNSIGIPQTEDLLYQDPFVSAAELSIHMKPKGEVSKISAHRWAHPISHIEKGCILVANEKLGGVFHQTVVLVVDHHEKSGTTGVVINR
jgi:putative transcriptional regulator